MTHSHIDEHAIAERYLKHALPPAERTAFEAHLVDCQECSDRVLLAEMFRLRNGVRNGAAPHPEPHDPLPADARLLLRLRPWEVTLMGATLLAALLLPLLYMLLR